MADHPALADSGAAPPQPRRGFFSVRLFLNAALPRPSRGRTLLPETNYSITHNGSYSHSPTDGVGPPRMQMKTQVRAVRVKQRAPATGISRSLVCLTGLEGGFDGKYPNAMGAARLEETHVV